MEGKTPPPVSLTSDGFTVHLSYIRRDIDSINNKLDNITSGFVSRIDFDEHLKTDADHESRIRNLKEFQDNLIGRMWGIGVLTGLVIGIITLVIGHFWK